MIDAQQPDGRIVRRRPRRRRSAGNLLAALAVSGTVVAAMAGISPRAVSADGPGSGSPWVVSVGDSYISGESGRWAGNTNGSSNSIDALGSQAYFDDANHTAETFPGCHRSAKPEIYNTFGNGGNWANLACSGAEIDSTFDSNGVITKPGIDWAADSQGHRGQAATLQSFAGSHNVKLVTMSIGGNNFHFGNMVATCVQDYVLTPVWWQAQCSADPSVTSNFTSTYASAQAYAIRGAILNVHQAMRNAGYADTSYTILVQDYPSPLAPSSSFRYPESASWAADIRQQIGGCGFWNADADFVNSTAVPVIDNAVYGGVVQAGQYLQQNGTSNVQFLELSSALNGHRLCENTVGLLEERGIAGWTSPGAADASEWVNQIRTLTAGGSSPYQQQESLHPDYWAQRAISNCLRQAYAAGSPSGRCTIAGSGLNSAGEPNMTFSRRQSVPNVVGMSTTQGAQVLSGAGFTPHVYQLPTCDTFTPGRVIDQSPAAGSWAYAGDLVAMTVNVKGSLRLCTGSGV